MVALKITRMAHMLSRIKLERFLTQVSQIQQTLENDKNISSIDAMEAIYTLDQLHTILSAASSSSLRFMQDVNLIDFLAQRWQRIRGSHLEYPQSFDNPINQLCIEIAKELSTSIAQCPHYLIILMPSLGLTQTQDYLSASPEDPDLHLQDCVLNDDESCLLHIPSVLALSEDGILRQNVLSDGKMLALSPDELEKLLNRDLSVKRAYEALQRQVRYRLSTHLRDEKLEDLEKDLSLKTTRMRERLRLTPRHTTSAEEYNESLLNKVFSSCLKMSPKHHLRPKDIAFIISLLALSEKKSKRLSPAAHALLQRILGTYPQAILNRVEMLIRHNKSALNLFRRNKHTGRLKPSASAQKPNDYQFFKSTSAQKRKKQHQHKSLEPLSEWTAQTEVDEDAAPSPRSPLQIP